jgi:hypothetical protein
MGFNLDRVARKIHHEIKPGTLIIDEQDCPIMAVFEVPTDVDVLDAFIVNLRTLPKKFEANPEELLYTEIRESALQVFTGWVNPEGREDLWVRNNGEPVDPTPETVHAFLSWPGVAMVICQEFIAAVGQGGTAAVGNSKPSRGSGFVDRVKDLDASSTAPATTR